MSVECKKCYFLKVNYGMDGWSTVDCKHETNIKKNYLGVKGFIEKPSAKNKDKNCRYFEQKRWWQIRNFI